MEMLNFCVILRRNSFSITERGGFNLSYAVKNVAASGGYLKLLAFENIGFSSNGEGENKILAPRAIILDQAAKPRGQELSAQGARILF